MSTFKTIQGKKIPTSIFKTPETASKTVAQEIADLIRLKQKQNENCVLGLATGSSPIKVYNELVRIHKEEGLSFNNVVTFNLDEYYPMKPGQTQSYVSFMNNHLFNHIDIPKENINIPDGTIDKDSINSYCRTYEQKIIQYGGIDIQLLGIGRTGHIGFNEPGSQINTSTRLINLNDVTVIDAADDFGSIRNVPKTAITMGIGTIMQTKKIILMAWGNKKASIIKKTIEGFITETIPATFLQVHPNTQFIMDETAAKELH